MHRCVVENIPKITNVLEVLFLGFSLLAILLTNCFTMDGGGTLSRIDVQTEYRTLVHTDADSRRHSSKMELLLWQFLYTVDPLVRLGNQTRAVVQKSIEVIPNWQPARAARAFSHIERFALNLIEQPWRQEFRTIKMYTGFWKIKIEKHLKEVMPLFTKLGYQGQGDELVMTASTPSKEQIYEVATDCRIAAKEMEFYDTLHENVDQKGYNLKDVHACRNTIAGDKETCIDWIQRNCNPTFEKLQNHFENARNSEPSNSNRRLSSDSVPSSRVKVDTVESPGDSGYKSPRQSAELTRLAQSSRESAEPNRSAEHARASRTEQMGDSGYKSKGPSVEHHRLPQSGSHIRGKSQSVEHLKRVGSAFSSAVENDYVDPIKTHSASFEDDLYKPKTMEDHLAESLKLVTQRSEKSSPNMVPDGADWAHVHKGLREKYGEDYYSGQRGDIIFSNKESGFKDISAAASPSGSSASPMSPAGKVAGIFKGAGRRSSPHTGSPLAAGPNNQASPLPDALRQSGLTEDSSPSPEIRQPPTTTYPLLGAEGHYPPPNFSTFGHDHKQERSNVSDFQHIYEPCKGPIDYSPESFGRRAGNDLTRRMYQADSNQSLNMDMFAPVLTAPVMSTKPDPVYAKPNKAAKRHTEPILRPKGPAPAVPQRRHPLSDPPASPAKPWQCPDCTYANPVARVACEMCGKTRQQPRGAGRQCGRCRSMNDEGRAKCKGCGHPLASDTYI